MLAVGIIVNLLLFSNCFCISPFHCSRPSQVTPAKSNLSSKLKAGKGLRGDPCGQRSAVDGCGRLSQGDESEPEDRGG